VGKTNVRYLAGVLGSLCVIAAALTALHGLSGGGSQETVAALRGAPDQQCSTTGMVVRCTSDDENPPPACPQIQTATGQYATPGGSEEIEVALRMRDGVIVEARVRLAAGSGTARQFQEQFASRFAVEVVGRPVAGLEVSRVAGASLTSTGFNKAVAQIALRPVGSASC